MHDSNNPEPTYQNQTHAFTCDTWGRAACYRHSARVVTASTLQRLFMPRKQTAHITIVPLSLFLAVALGHWQRYFSVLCDHSSACRLRQMECLPLRRYIPRISRFMCCATSHSHMQIGRSSLRISTPDPVPRMTLYHLLQQHKSKDVIGVEL
jgi:hypothetical protein